MTHTGNLILAAGGGAEKYGLVLPVQWESLIWTFVIFGLLLLVLKKFAWGPLMAAVETREKTISDSLKKAEEVQRASVEIAARQEAALAEAQLQAKAILEEARVNAERFGKQEAAKAAAGAQEFLDRARREIALEENRARDSLRREVVELTLQAASQVLARSITAEDERRLAGEVVEQLRSQRVGAARN
jgi:F-type H+-transporting ATPase subunit b